MNESDCQQKMCAPFKAFTPEKEFKENRFTESFKYVI